MYLEAGLILNVSAIALNNVRKIKAIKVVGDSRQVAIIIVVTVKGTAALIALNDASLSSYYAYYALPDPFSPYKPTLNLPLTSVYK